MSGDFVWAIKNGDLEQVKDIVEKKVSIKCDRTLENLH